MERALNYDTLTIALGELPDVPGPDELQRLLADAELSLFAGQLEIPDQLIRVGWYLHAVGSTGRDRVPWDRRQRAFRISAHILELAAADVERDRSERLQLVFGAEVGYRRGGLDPNAAAVFAQARSLLIDPVGEQRDWWATVALEAGVHLLSFRTSETFAWLRGRRPGFSALRRRIALTDLAGTMFGPAEHVVEACFGILRFLIFGDRPALVSAQRRLTRVLDAGEEPATTTERWIAACLLALSAEFDAASVWTALPPDVPDAARRALTSTFPPVLTLWEPQRELLAGRQGTPHVLSLATRRAVLAVPTSAGKTLVAQIIVLAELAAERSVCLVAPQRSLVREIRRALHPRVRALRKRLGHELPDFLADFAAELLRDEAPDVDVMTPERFAALLRADPEAVLSRYQLFVFDEAHLVGDPGRGFSLEGALTYLHWRTQSTEHRIILMSAAIGNEAAFQTWLQRGEPGEPYRSPWRGPRRLTAAFTTRAEWREETHIVPKGRERIHRLSYPLRGVISFAVPGAGTRSYQTVKPIGELVFKRNHDGTRGDRDSDRSTPHYKHVAGLAAFLGRVGPVLTVTGTRLDAQRLARAIASHLPERDGTDRARDAIGAMLDPAHPLVALLPHGVAYHHAGLPLEVLALLEDELRAGRLEHLVSTTTLTEGVNLPVRTVVLAETRWEGSEVHLAGPRMLNALGRAGRAGIETEGWVVFAPSGRAPSDPERHLPQPEQLEIRSQLATEQTLDALVAFESRRREAADAVFGDVPEALHQFTSFVWYVLACEEVLGSILDAERLDEIVGTLFVARQIGPDDLARLRAFSQDVRSTYISSDPTRRRAWARPGTRVASARQLDDLGRQLATAAVDREDRSEAAAAVALLDETGILDALLELPDIDDDVWTFRVSPRGRARIDVDLADVLVRWIGGQPLAGIADAVLRDITDREWRLEQIVDRVSRGFGHAISWMIASALERANLGVSWGG